MTLLRYTELSGLPSGLSRRAFARRINKDGELLSKWTAEYGELRTSALEASLDHDGLLERFRRGRSLPRGYGFVLDERIIEFPWALSRGPFGKTLDAGSALNHRFVLERVLPLVDSLVISTLTPEPATYVDPRITRRAADLRDTPFLDAEFDTVVSISTLEHVGMDNSGYGADESRSDNPDVDLGRAVSELRRVLRPGGRLLATVPYGVPEDHGWLRQFDDRGVARILDWFGPASSCVSIFHCTSSGWERSTLQKAAGARYHDHLADPEMPRDFAAAARAVACLELVRS